MVLKEELVEYLVDQIKNRNFDTFNDEDEEEDLDNKSAKEKALAKLRHFKSYGWISEDVGSDFSTYISLDDSALVIIETLTNLIKQDESAIEYSGYILNIYYLLTSFDFSNATSRIEQVYKSTRELNNSLRGLNSNIKKYLQAMMNRDDLSANDVLRLLLDEYQQKIILTVFSNLKAKDNPSKYSDRILETLYFLLEENNLTKIISNYLETKKISDCSQESLNFIEQKVTDQIKYVINSFESLIDLIDLIDEKNSRFLNSARAKLTFIINNNQDFEGKIISILKKLKSTADSEDIFERLNVFSTKQVDEQSIYSPRFNKEKPSKIDLNIEEVTDFEKEVAYKQVFKEDEFSKTKINQFVQDCLHDRDSIACNEIPVTDYSTLMKLLLIQLYGVENGMIYQVEFTDEYCDVFNHRFKKFIVIKKGQSYGG